MVVWWVGAGALVALSAVVRAGSMRPWMLAGSLGMRSVWPTRSLCGEARGLARLMASANLEVPKMRRLMPSKPVSPR